MIKELKNKVALLIMPIVRLYIKWAPVPYLKRFFWSHICWRDKNYCAKSKFGAKMRGRTGDLVQGYIYYFGIWEPNLTNFITLRLLGKAGRTFVDVGANVGYFSLLAAHCMSAGNVVSIEAFKETYIKLVENVKLNGYRNIRAINYAVTDGRRLVSMFPSPSSNEGATTSIAGRFQSTASIVEGFPLSDLLSDEEIETVRLIKIDVEGGEYHVFKGMEPLLKRFPKDAEVVVEISPSALGEERMREVFSGFEAEGFLPYILENTYDAEYYMFRQEITRPRRMTERPTAQQDIVFSRIVAEYL